LVTAQDPELPALLRPNFPAAIFATADQVRAIINVKPGPLVIVLDASDAGLVAGLLRKDVRAVAVVTPQRVPIVFRRPIVTFVERPLVSTKVVLAIRLAVTELSP